MRICVIGRHGQLASALAQECAELNIEIIQIGRPELDLMNADNALALIGAMNPDVVVNAAAYTAVDAAESNEPAAQAINVEGPRILAQATAALGIPIIHVSTDYVFDGAKATPYTEDDITGPINLYGRTKLDGERALGEANPRHVILRTSWIYAHEGSNFVRTMLRLAGNGVVRVVSDQFGSPTYATDLARAILKISINIIDAPPSDERFGLFHVAGAGDTSWAGLAQAVFAGGAAHGLHEAHVSPIDSASFPTAARRPANSRLDCTRVRLVHGIVMPLWPNGLARCLAKLAPFTESPRP
jgi:dTDP-4-dehydrorhamnose reductase